jgi:hypothetical protein
MLYVLLRLSVDHREPRCVNAILATHFLLKTAKEQRALLLFWLVHKPWHPSISAKNVIALAADLREEQQKQRARAARALRAMPAMREYLLVSTPAGAMP